MADDDLNNEDIVNALKNPAQFSNKQFFPQRPEGAITDWITGQGEKVKSGLEGILKHPEDLPAPGNLTGIMAGPLAKTANMPALHEALHGVLAKRTPENIFDRTGWFQGADQALRHEIPDAGMQAKMLGSTRPDLEANLSHFIEHPELFKAYPQLKGYSLKIDPDLGPESAGEHIPGAIKVGGSARQGGLSDEQQRTLIHELQHGVQHIEGWPTGRYPEYIRKKVLGVTDRYEDRLDQAGLPHDHPARQELEHVKNWLTQNKNDVAFQMYKGLPGETEARNAMDRFFYDKYGRNNYGYSPEFSRRMDVIRALQPHNIGIGVSDNALRQFSPGGGSFKMLAPNDLPREIRPMYDRLQKPDTLEMMGDRKYPWKTEDLPRSKQFQYVKTR